MYRPDRLAHHYDWDVPALPGSPGDGSDKGSTHNFFKDLNVPVLQAIGGIWKPRSQLTEDSIGLNASEGFLERCWTRVRWTDQITVPFALVLR